MRKAHTFPILLGHYLVTDDRFSQLCIWDIPLRFLPQSHDYGVISTLMVKGRLANRGNATPGSDGVCTVTITNYYIITPLGSTPLPLYVCVC